MSSTPFISHSVNGYSRYDIPESVAFTASAGILYPVRCDFMNARDIRYVQAGCMIRTNPAVVPTFTPFRVSLHRFFCPMQLYHPEMRVNSSKFDLQNLSTNVIRTEYRYSIGTQKNDVPEIPTCVDSFLGRNLIAFLGLSSGHRFNSSATVTDEPNFMPNGSESSLSEWGRSFVNADPVLAYYDIIRCYYSFSQLGTFSIAFPICPDLVSSQLELPYPTPGSTVSKPTEATSFFTVGSPGQYWRQTIAKLDFLDEFFESRFYPVYGEAQGLYYDRGTQLISAISDCMYGSRIPAGDQSMYYDYTYYYIERNQRFRDLSNPGNVYNTELIPISDYWVGMLPYGVAPSVADRFSRLLPATVGTDVSLSNITTIRGLAYAAKLQAYKDLITSGGSRFTDWLMTFFAAKVSHVDRPVLVYSNSFYMNSSPIFSQQGGDSLGTYAGVIEGQNSFGKKAQRYSFDEPGYLVDIVCIRPLYYWAGIQADYARYDKMDYFNPIFNQIGYEYIPGTTFGMNSDRVASTALAKQPCYNEFRASYDRVLGDMARVPNETLPNSTLYNWVQQRVAPYTFSNSDLLQGAQDWLNSVYFTDVNQANSVFASTSEDNFFVNVYYNVTSKSLVSKNFATNLSTR